MKKYYSVINLLIENPSKNFIFEDNKIKENNVYYYQTSMKKIDFIKLLENESISLYNIELFKKIFNRESYKECLLEIEEELKSVIPQHDINSSIRYFEEYYVNEYNDFEYDFDNSDINIMLINAEDLFYINVSDKNGKPINYLIENEDKSKDLFYNLFEKERKIQDKKLSNRIKKYLAEWHSKTDFEDAHYYH